MNSETPKKYYHYWGKATGSAGENPLEYHLLVYHCLDVAAVGFQILATDPSLLEKFVPERERTVERSREHLTALVSLLLALHDIGKFSERFQYRRPDILIKLQGQTSAGNYTVWHDDMGRLIIEDMIWPLVWEENWFGLDPTGDRTDWIYTLRPWFYAVTGHHGQPPRRPDSGLAVPQLFSENNRNAAQEFTEWCSKLFFKDSAGFCLPYSDQSEEFFRNSSWPLAGLAVLSDWIGSNREYFPMCSDPMPLETYWRMYALPRASEAIAKAGILPCKVSGATGMTALFPEYADLSPLQSFVSSCGILQQPQLFIIEEATGSGKTEAALVLAHRMMALGLGKGIFFGLPTMATADAMYGRMADAYGNLFSKDQHPSLVLAHSGRKFSEKFNKTIITDDVRHDANPDHEHSAEAECTAWLADNRKKALLAHIGVGTIDQALMAVLPLRHQSLRLLGLSRNILIVDEVHAYEPYVKTVLENLLEFHAALGGSAILLSATLPYSHRQDFISHFCKGLGVQDVPVREHKYPLVIHASSGDISPFTIDPCKRTHRTVEVECVDIPEKVLEYLGDVIAQNRCACWIRNTVDDAIDAYQSLAAKFGSDHVILFHARFTMGDRLDIEHEVLRIFGKDSTLEVRQGMILVSTQVIEQSLDLDFDLMVTDLAPMDLIIQRSGRLHRHDRSGRGSPRLVVLMPRMTASPDAGWYKSVFPKGAFVYEHHGELWLTARLLSERRRITMPDDARLLIEGVFGEEAKRKIPQSLIVQEGKADGGDMSSTAVASLNILRLDDGYKSTANHWEIDARVPTRLGEARVTILLLRWDGEELSFWSSHPEFADEMSQVSIAEHKLSSAGTYGGKLGRALEEFRMTLRDEGRWRVLIPLSESGGIWQGDGFDNKKKPVTVHYDSITGLVISKGNG